MRLRVVVRNQPRFRSLRRAITAWRAPGGTGRFPQMSDRVLWLVDDEAEAGGDGRTAQVEDLDLQVPGTRLRGGQQWGTPPGGRHNGDVVIEVVVLARDR